MANGKLKYAIDFKKSVKQLSAKLFPEPRDNIRGHDFTYLLFLTAKQEGGHRWGIRNHENFESILYGFVDLSNLENEELFIKLVSL